MKKHRWDFVIIIVLLLGAGLSWILINNFYYSQGNYVEISVDGELEKTLSLDKDTVYQIKTKKFKNIIEIKDGQVYMKEADCPDHLCVKQGKISKSGQTIICLPHKIIVTVISDNDAEVDAHTN